jgi:membrane protease YdiL (CAAX protease family)
MTPLTSKSDKYRSLGGMALVLVLLFVFPEVLRSYNRVVLGETEVSLPMFLISRLFYWLCLIVLWRYAVKIEGKPFLLYEERKHPIWKYPLFLIGTYVVLFLGLLIIGLIVFLLKTKEESTIFKQIVDLLRGNYFMIFFTSLTAGVVEEFIFRGYLQPRLEILLKNKWIAILIASVLFGLLHYGYGTWINMLGPFFIGLVFAIFYDKFRSLKFLIFFHFLWDFVILMIQTNR